MLGLAKLGFDNEQITQVRNPTWQEVQEAVMEISTKIFEDSKRGVKSLLFVYFAGHGQQEASNQALILNEERTYPLEKMLRTLSKNEMGYVISVFDCCRDQAKPEQHRGNGKHFQAQDSGIFLLDVLENTSVTSKMRYVAFYGCEPSGGVPADSKLVRVLFGHFWQYAERNGDMKIYFPQDIVGFHGTDGRAEKLIIGQPIVLTWTETESETDKDALTSTFRSSAKHSDTFDVQLLRELD